MYNTSVHVCVHVCVIIHKHKMIINLLLLNLFGLILPLIVTAGSVYPYLNQLEHLKKLKKLQVTLYLKKMHIHVMYVHVTQKIEVGISSNLLHSISTSICIRKCNKNWRSFFGHFLEKSMGYSTVIFSDFGPF